MRKGKIEVKGKKQKGESLETVFQSFFA